MNYKDKPVRNGIVSLRVREQTSTNNYYRNSNNKFGDFRIKDDSAETLYGCYFGYDEDDTYGYTHPPVYSPINGKIIEAKNGRVIIKEKGEAKIINGEDFEEIYYYHKFEHLHLIAVEKGQIISEGQKIGTLGGTDYHTGYNFSYLQQVGYSLFMDNKYFTGKVGSISYTKSLAPNDFIRYIDPEKYWDNREEVGMEDSKTIKKEDEKNG